MAKYFILGEAGQAELWLVDVREEWNSCAGGEIQRRWFGQGH